MHMYRGKIGSGCYTQLHFQILGHALMVVNHHSVSRVEQAKKTSPPTISVSCIVTETVRVL